MTDDDAKILGAEAKLLEGEVLKDGEGPPLGGAEDVEEQAMPPHELLAFLLDIGFSVLAPNWQVSKKETSMLGKAYFDAVMHYFPSFEVGPFGAALGATAMIVIPRLGVPRKVEPEPTPEEGETPSVPSG